MLGERFKVLCMDAGLTAHQAGKILHVTPRTVRYWMAGQVAVPYSAYKLLRVMRYFELPGARWRGWHFHSGKLWTPEGHGFLPEDGAWWSLLVRQARGAAGLFKQVTEMRLAALPKAGDGGAAPAPGLGGLSHTKQRETDTVANQVIPTLPRRQDDITIGAWPILCDSLTPSTLPPAAAPITSASPSTPSFALPSTPIFVGKLAPPTPFQTVRTAQIPAPNPPPRPHLEQRPSHRPPTLRASPEKSAKRPTKPSRRLVAPSSSGSSVDLAGGAA